MKEVGRLPNLATANTHLLEKIRDDIEQIVDEYLADYKKLADGEQITEAPILLGKIKILIDYTMLLGKVMREKDMRIFELERQVNDRRFY